MGKQYLKILQTIPVYATHEISAKIIGTLSAEQLIPFNREKKRNGLHWMEIYLNGEKKGYIRKKSGTYYKCEMVILKDESTIGFKYTLKKAIPVPISQLFFPVGRLLLNTPKDDIGQIKLEAIENTAEKKGVSITLEYPKELVDVKGIGFKKGDKFYITHKTDAKNDIFMEVNDLNHKQGLLLKKTNTSSVEDEWMSVLATIIAILVVIGIFIGFLANGWIVVSGLMIIPGIIVAVIVIVVLQLLLMILKGIFHQIRIRF